MIRVPLAKKRRPRAARQYFLKILSRHRKPVKQARPEVIDAFSPRLAGNIREPERC
jgi:hypothetical protein